MTRWKWIAAGLLLISFLVVFVLAAGRFQVKPLPAGAANQTPPPTPARGYVLLPESEVNTYVQFYLVNPHEEVRAWQPSNTDIDELEGNLSQIPDLESPSNSRIKNPQEYFRQYLGVTISGEKRIFVNATCQFWGDDSSEWRHRLKVIIDGGKCYWQAFYNPVTHKFSNLMINAVA